MRKHLYILSFSSLILGNLYGQNSEKAMLDQFFVIYQEDPVAALDYIYDFNPWIASQGEAVQSLKDKLNPFIPLAGDYQEAEFIPTGRLRERFSMFIYLAKYDLQPLRFTFEFYKPKDRWMLYAFSFDNNFNEDMKDLLKRDLLKGKP